MGVSDNVSSWSAFITSVLVTTETIMGQGDLSIGFYAVFEASTGILRLVDTFQTNKEDIQVTAVFVAEVTQCVIEGKDTAGWTDGHTSYLENTLKDLREYLEDLQIKSSNWLQQAYDEAQQISRAESIARDLEKHNQNVLNATVVLQLNLQIRRDLIADETHDAVKKSVKLLKVFKDDLGQTNDTLNNYASKLDAVLEVGILLVRTLEHYENEVRLRNRRADPKVVESLEELQRQVDLKAQKQKNSSAPLNLKKHIQVWMLASMMVDFDRGQLIGQTATAEVFKGTYLGKPVAVKCFLGLLNTDSYDLERDIVREITQWSKVSKLPHVLELKGVCTKVSRPLIVSQWCPHSLETYLEKRPSSLLSMVYQMILAIVSIHGEDVVHGDIKTSNFLVDDENILKLTDFSLAKAAITTMSRHVSKNDQVGQIINWMSPEMRFTARKAGKPADIWSLAMTVSHLLSKEIPYQGRTNSQIEQALKSDNDRPERPANLNPGLYPLWNQLEKCWLTETSQRPTAQALQEFMEDTYNIHRPPRVPEDVVLHVHSAYDLPKPKMFGKLHPYVEIGLNGETHTSSTDAKNYTAPQWNSLIQLGSSSELDMNGKVEIRVMNDAKRNYIASVPDITLRQLFEERKHNNDEKSQHHKRGFRLHPQGHIVIDAFIVKHDEPESAPPKRVDMMRICAVNGAQDIDLDCDESSRVKAGVCFVGSLGSGKSTLINSLHGHKVCATNDHGDCTQEVTPVGQPLGLSAVDTPSFPMDGDNTPITRALNSCRVAVIVFEKPVAEIVEVAKLAQSADCQIIFVRNKRGLLPHLLDDPTTNLTSYANSTLNKDSNDIQRLLGLTTCKNFYIDARAVLRARLAEGEPVQLEFLEAWIALVEAIRIANGNPLSHTERTDLKFIPYN
ncbi:unnamed protein product [Aphanomyces euteiches]